MVSTKIFFPAPLTIPFNKLAVVALSDDNNFYQVSPSPVELFFDDFCDAFEAFMEKVEEGFSCDILDHTGHSQIICPI